MNRTVLIAALAMGLGACGPLPPRKQDAAEAAKPPATKPQRNVTNFSDALRCMDNMYLGYGTRDVSVVIEDITDTTKKVTAGTRDMTMSAISDMTRRSRAIQVISFGQDANNIVAFLNNAQKRTAFAVVPQYDLRGSVSQFDEGVLRRQADAGVSVGSTVSGGASKSRQVSVLGLDLALANTNNLALIPGVVSKNITTIVKEGDALDSEATFSKVGINFSTNFQRTDGTAQALRNMIELATIELFGKLLKLPYWSCIGVEFDNPEVKKEIEDWFIGMERSGELTPFFQEQLRNRRFYDGPSDGRITPALRQAVAAYRNAVGLGNLDAVDLAFFARFLAGPFPQPPAQPFRDAPVAVAPPSQPQPQPEPPKPARIRLDLAAAKPEFAVNEAMSFTIRSNAPAYVYCYARSVAGEIQRIFPNRFLRDPRVMPGTVLVLPGDQGFRIAVDGAGSVTVACMAAPREIYNDVPAALRWGDFQTLNKVKGFEDIKSLLEAIAKEPVEVAQLDLKAQRK